MSTKKRKKYSVACSTNALPIASAMAAVLYMLQFLEASTNNQHAMAKSTTKGLKDVSMAALAKKDETRFGELVPMIHEGLVLLGKKVKNPILKLIIGQVDALVLSLGGT